MLNMMQMVVLMPMLGILCPTNVAYYLSIFLNIMNFKLIPTDKILDAMLKVKGTASNTTDSTLA